MSVMSLLFKTCEALLVLAMSVAIANAEPDSDALRLRLECQGSHITIGEPAWFFISMHNSSNHTINPYPSVIDNTILLCSMDGNDYSPCVYGRMWRDSLGTLDMYPGRVVWHGEVRLYLKGTPGTALDQYESYVAELVFSRPGTYYVKAEPGDPAAHESDPVQVTVAPLPKGERPVMEIWSRPEVATFIQGYTHKEGVAPLERLLEQYPDSLYADHARYALGEYWAGQYFTKKTSDPHILRKASVHFAAVTERVPIRKMRALYQQLVIVDRKLFMSDEVDLEALARELEPRMSLADRIGLGEKIRERLPRVLAREKPTAAPTATQP
ncbi:MAG: hypothetical protein HYV63_02330 [Candidatus Schekmanbacteria bacterium]|nr:hypothetical protein [Candidatus Schekmanbacteria bacterium]